MHPDLDHERWMAAHAQLWCVRYAWLFAIAGVASFVVMTPGLFAAAFWLALMVRDAREDRNRALERVRAMERVHGRVE